jgi:basic membrane protein A
MKNLNPFVRHLLKASAALSLCLSLNTAFAGPANKVGLVLDKGGKDDKSFNSAAYLGLERAKKELGVSTKYVEASDDNSFEPMLRSFAQKDFDLIIAIGFSQSEAVKKVAPQFPNKHFVIIDGDVTAPNVKSIIFEEHEGAFLVGALAALSSHVNKFGFVGGMDIPLIRRFEMGYEAGLKKVNPKAQLTSNFVGVTGDAWNNPAKAKELAMSQFASGIDIIFGAAGASNAGVFDAAEEAHKLAIGVDSNQNWIKPGFVLTSMLKRVDVAVYDACKEATDGAFKAGSMHMGLANKGIDYALDSYNAKLVKPEVRKKIDALKAQIIAGKIVVPDFYKKKTAQ